ncbi:MAG: membrane-bound lytic murein transglycosylase D [Gammaproteobacteria bacterium]|nr:MAG: membrane-bound lytic murein transglycosylase D [Gammaproteobacteria bacterium]TND02145.1 MAG: membrane-bound lytic murein transglycosylase D [Gammaproteobacteria bacterium]
MIAMKKSRHHRLAGTILLGLVCTVIGSCAAPGHRAATPPAESTSKPAHGSPSSDDVTTLGDAGPSPTTGADTIAAAAAIPADELLQYDATEPVPTLIEVDLWQRIRGGYALVDYGNPRVEAERQWFTKHVAYLDRVAERAEPYLYHIVEEVEKRGMPMEIALLPIIESAFQPLAYSHGRAAGIWQFIPSTGELYGLKQNWWYDGRRDIIASTDAALRYLQKLSETFDGDWLLALAAYNSGAGTVTNAIKANIAKNKPTDFWSLSLPAETSTYVPRLLAVSSIIEQPEHYGITLRSIANEASIMTVDTGRQIDLALAADLSGISLENMYRLNPGFNRWATDPDGPHMLVLPVEKGERFRSALAQLPPEKRIRWELHRIRGGETLNQIAQKYSTTVQVLKDVNKLDGHVIHADQNLVIPVATRSLASYSLSERQRLVTRQNTSSRTGLKVAYVVKPGDTFWDIARKHKVEVNQLASWNNIAPRDTLRIGQKLVVWSSVKTAAAPGMPSTQQRINYTVRRGDSLAGISQKFNVNLNDLVRWNSLDKTKHLQPGQKLVLVVDVTRQAENT